MAAGERSRPRGRGKRGGTAGPTPRPRRRRGTLVSEQTVAVERARDEEEASRVQRFEPVDPKVSFPELELRLLEAWKASDVFRRSVEARAGGPRWVFYEGPPTANGKPGVHHVEARVFKDLFPRFRTMTGHYVQRKGGWDCHGLP